MINEENAGMLGESSCNEGWKGVDKGTERWKFVDVGKKRNDCPPPDEDHDARDHYP